MQYRDVRGAGLVVAGLVLAAGLVGAEEETWELPEWRNAAWAARGCTNDLRGKWFRDAKFGAFIHFGPYSQLGGYWQGKGPCRPAEQIIGLGDHQAVIPVAQYRKEVAGAFNPTNFNARTWVHAIKRAGQKYVIVTTKHHDGFCMFRTATTSYNAVEATPFGRDVIKELADECRRQGIEFCPYYSIGDWCAKEVQGPQFKTYQDYMFAQLKELLTNYGDVKLLWFDNYWYVNNQWRNELASAQGLYAYVRSLSPNVLINDRCGRGVSSTDGDYVTPENQLKGSRQSRYFEVVMTNTEDDNWGWVNGATNYRTPAQLIRNLIDCTSKGGNFVLNVGPTASGEFPPEHLANLEVIGKWMHVNGAAIYGTVPAPECVVAEAGEAACYTTKKDSEIFVHVVNWPAKAAPLHLQIARPGLQKVEWLDPAVDKMHSQSAVVGNTTTVTIYQPAKVNEYATVVRLAFKDGGTP